MPEGGRRQPGMLRSWLERLVDVRDEEVSPLVWSVGYFFLVLASYYILRPVRDEMGLVGGVRNLPYLYLGTLGGMLVANPIFAWLVIRYPRRVFIPLANRFFAACILIFFVAMKLGPAEGSPLVARVFFVWVSVFNMFVVSIFWALMADLWSNAQGKRLFGLVGVGGTAGALLGSGTTALLVEHVGAASLLLGSALLLEGAVQCVKRLMRLFGVDEPGAPDAAPSPAKTTPGGRPSGPEPVTLRGLVNGIRLAVGSPYLAGICVYIFLYTLTSTFLYFEQANIVDAAITDRAARTAFFARIDVAVNALTIVVQLFLTGRIIGLLGVALTLAFVPVVSVAGFSALAASPTLGVVAAFQIARRGLNYAVARPAREVLYTVVGREEKYKAKSFIDTFVYRTGDAIGAWSFGLLSAILTSLAGIALVAVPIAAVWGAVGVWLGRRQRDLASGAPAAAVPEPPTTT